MFLDYIEITNFRPYYGTQRIESGVDKDKNFTVILANNGSGKTSLVNALTWCLFGEELHDIRDKSEPLYNKKAAEEALEESPHNPEVDVSVKIKFHYFDERDIKKNFIITRSLTFSRWVGNEWTSPMSDTLFVEDGNKDIQEDDVAQDSINKRIPQDMFQYFFFNGASLSNYFESSSPGKSNIALKKSIEEISQIDLVNKVQSHLNNMLSDYNKEYSKKKGKNDVNYNDQINNVIIKIQESESQRDENYKRIDEAIANEQYAQNKLKNVNSNDVNELSTRRDKLENDKKRLASLIKSESEEYEDTILDLFPIVALFDELVKSIEICDEGINNKTVPAVEKDLLKDILKEGYCICGTKLDDHPECLEEIKARLAKTSKVDTTGFFEEYYSIKKVINKLKDLPKIDRLRGSIELNKDTLNSIINELNSISEQLSSFDVEEIALYENQYQQNKSLKERLRRNNEKLNSSIEKLKNKKEQLEKERNEFNETKKELVDLNNKIMFCENVIDISSNLKDKIQTYIREKITQKTKEQFTGINWAYNKFIDVNISEDYSIRITKSDGEIVKPGDLSDGEENLLALSFMMALHSITGFEIPLFIDAPLEKLDKSKRLEFIDNLHEFTKNKQLVFLFTDSQYTEEVRAHMLKHVIDEYELKPYENKTEIVNHG